MQLGKRKDVFGLNFISLYKLQAETYNTHYDNNTGHLHNRGSEESQNDFCNPSPRKRCVYCNMSEKN